MSFINPLTDATSEKLRYDIFEKMYIDSLPNVDINTMFKNDCSFYMPDKLKKM